MFDFRQLNKRKNCLESGVLFFPQISNNYVRYLSNETNVLLLSSKLRIKLKS